VVNRSEFAAFMRQQFDDEIDTLRQAGQDEYAGGENAFGNFERLAAQLGISREEVLLVYFMKHVDGIFSWVRGHRSQREPVQGRVRDSIVYLFLLLGMAEEGERSGEETSPSLRALDLLANLAVRVAKLESGATLKVEEVDPTCDACHKSKSEHADDGVGLLCPRDLDVIDPIGINPKPTDTPLWCGPVHEVEQTAAISKEASRCSRCGRVSAIGADGLCMSCPGEESSQAATPPESMLPCPNRVPIGGNPGHPPVCASFCGCSAPGTSYGKVEPKPIGPCRNPWHNMAPFYQASNSCPECSEGGGGKAGA
jgi:hypothetical protein